MEKQIKSFSELKTGDLVLIESPMSQLSGTIEDDLCVVSSIIDTHKYPIIDSASNRKFRMHNRLPVYADQCGDTGNEMIKEYCIESSKHGSYNFLEDDTPIWNIRLIDKTHPKWDSKLSRQGKMTSVFLNIAGKIFN
jgi:hypothetical protein